MEHLAEKFFTVASEAIPIWNWKRENDNGQLYAKVKKSANSKTLVQV